MASFLLSNALKGANNLSSLVGKVSQMRDELEKQMDSAVGEEDEGEGDGSKDSASPLPLPDPVAVVVAAVDKAEEEGEDRQSAQETTLVEGAVDEPVAVSLEAVEVVAVEPVQEEQPGELHNTVQAALKRREAQLEKTTRKLAEQEDTLQQLREQVELLQSDKRVKQAEAKAQGLLKEGLVLAEKEGKAQAQLRKLRAEKDQLVARESALKSSLQAETQARQAFEAELAELKLTRRKDELDRAHLSESSSETKKRVDELRQQLAQFERREVEAKLDHDRVALELQEQKKLVFSLSQQLGTAKRDAEHARFQLKEQLDNGTLHGSRADLMERTLHEAKLATEEQWKETRQVEQMLRTQLAKANEQIVLWERKSEEAAQRALELTSPLLRQIDLLNEQRAKTEQATSTLLTRAVTSEAAEADAIAQKRKSESLKSELQVKLSELETALSSAQMDLSRANSDGRLLGKRVEEAERERDLLQKQLDQMRASTDSKVADHRQTEMQLRQTLALEQEKTDRAKRTWEDRVRQLEQQQQQHQQQQQQAYYAAPTPAATTATVLPSPSVRSNNTAATVPGYNSQEEILGSVLFGDDFSPNSVAVDFAGSSSTFLLQASELQAGVRRRDLKISALVEQLDLCKRQRDELNHELHVVRAKLVGVDAAIDRQRELDTCRMQNALLCELLGEKEEQIEGLQADVDALKQQFRAQFQKI